MQAIQFKNVRANEPAAPKILALSRNKENVCAEKKTSHSEKLKKTIENKLNEMKNWESPDLVLAKKRDLEEKINTYNNNMRNLKVNSQGFSKSLLLVTSLIKDLDDKMHKIKSIKSRRII
jgi:hypothetical protein